MAVTVNGQENWFNEDAKFYKDVYVYGSLYYDFDGLGDNLILDHLEAKSLKVSGISTFVGDVNFDIITGNTVEATKIDSTTIDTDNIIVRDKLELTNDGGTNYLSAFASGDYAGRLGIGTAEPEQLLDVAGDIRLRNHIYDSSDEKGSGFGYYLSQDATGVRWVYVPPDALSEGFFIQNEGDNVGVGSYTTLNFIGNTGGGDIIQAVENNDDTKIVDITVVSHWLKNNSGLGTSGSVGIGSTQPTATLDVVGDARIVGILTSNNIVVTGITTTENLLVTGITTLGVTTASSLQVTGVATFQSNVHLGDDDQIQFGDDNDAIIKVDGSQNFYLQGDGTTYLRGSTVIVGANGGAGGFESAIKVSEVSAETSQVELFYDNSAKLTTTGYGVTVTGGLNVSGVSTFQDDVNIGIGGTTSFFDVSSGNVGIGSTIPTATLDVNGTLNVSGITTLGVTTASSLFVSGITTLGVTTVSSLFVSGISTFQDDVNIGTGGTTAFFDISSGNVGIGSTIPTATLDVNGDVAIGRSIFDSNAGVGKTDYRLASVGTGVSWRPPGVETTNILYVTKDGNDSNSGLLEGDAKATIGGAAAVAQDGDTIYVRPGTYFENNPIGLRTDVSISGQDLRLVTVVPNNPTEDLFHVRRGCLIENMNFAGNNVSIDHTGAAMVAFPPTGSATQNSGYVSAGPANEGPSGRYRSPYVRNCTNFATGSVGMRVDGNHVNAAYTGTNNLGQDLKSMVVDSYTQYNQNGIGVSLTNKAYAQLVSIFTINCDIAIYASSGGQCDLTNSNSSFGNYGLYADGTSGDEFTGITTVAADAESDTFTFADIRDSDSNVRKPFDGQGAFFRLNLDSYSDTGTKTGIVTEPLRTVRSISITNAGSGYTSTNPPVVTITSPLGPEAIDAELSANVNAAGSVSSIDVIASGRNFLPAGSGTNQQDISVTIAAPTSGTTATADAVTDPILFTVASSTEPTTSTGIGTITFNEFVPYSVGVGTSVAFRRLSRIITSSHSFEYVGAGTDINRANPFQGGVPIPENEVVAINGGQVPFTSTDQKGNFKIGNGLTIDQTTSTISGRDFNRAIQANLTPLIIALGG